MGGNFGIGYSISAIVNAMMRETEAYLPCLTMVIQITVLIYGTRIHIYIKPACHQSNLLSHMKR